MNTRGNDHLREMLAAEYALGTLRGGARRRFERWMRSDPDLAALSLAWSGRLAPLIDQLSERVPPARVWSAIEARLPGHSRGRSVSSSAGWWDRLALWRGIAAAFAVITAVAIAVALRPAPVPETQFVQVETLPGAVATVTDQKSGALVAVVMASRAGDELIVKVAADVQVESGATVHLAAVDRAKVVDAKAFGLSLEPAGGSPQPTHVLGLGALVRLSS
jgi:anti-sigma-K factor RskA